MKKRIFGIIIAILFFIFVLIQMANYMSKRNKIFTWPEVGLATLIPDPSNPNGLIKIDDEHEFFAVVYDISDYSYTEYVRKCRTKGFDLYYLSDLTTFSAYDNKGNYLKLSYVASENNMYINVIETDEARILKDIIHYELEYRTFEENYTNFDRALGKYLIPVRTTIKELNKDFPFVMVSEHNITSPTNHEYLGLEDEDEIWVLATCLDNYKSDTVKFTYDELNLYTDELEIKTHFDILEDRPSSVGKSKIIVLSIIPVRQ